MRPNKNFTFMTATSFYQCCIHLQTYTRPKNNLLTREDCASQIILQERKQKRYKCILLGCYPDCTTWQLTAEHRSRRRSLDAAVELEDERQLHLFDAQTAKLHPNHSSAEELKDEYVCSIPSTPQGVRQVCIFLFVFFIHPTLLNLFFPYFNCRL